MARRPTVASSVASSGVEPATTPDAVGTRIAEIRGALRQDEFAAEIGVHANTLGRYERGERLPDTDFLVALSTKKNISADWLLFGLPPMKATEAADNSLRQLALARYHTTGLSSELKASAPDPDAAYVKLYDVEVGGGRAKVVPEQGRVLAYRIFSRAWLRDEMLATEDDVYLVTVRGDSMQGVLNDRDIVLVDRRVREIAAEEVYIIRIDDALVVKYAQRQPGGIVHVWSANERVSPPFNVDLNDPRVGDNFAVLGLAWWRGGRIRRFT